MDKLSVLIASDSFKGSVSSLGIADLLEQGIHRVVPDCEVRKFAIADGGEGTVEAIVSGVGGEMREVEVSGPLGDTVCAHYGFIGEDTAILEMAEASGITLIEQNSDNALRASTWGVGQVMLDAIDHGAKRIYIGLGGSATSDGGAGMAKALGMHVLGLTLAANESGAPAVSHESVLEAAGERAEDFERLVRGVLGLL